jgi:hypothetical protein
MFSDVISYNIVEISPTFQTNVIPPSSGLKSKWSKQRMRHCVLVACSKNDFCYWDVFQCSLITPDKPWYNKGGAVAQGVSRWFPTAAARIRAQVRSYGVCGGQSGAGSGFTRILCFPLPIFIPPIAPQSQSSIIWGLYNRPYTYVYTKDFTSDFFFCLLFVFCLILSSVGHFTPWGRFWSNRMEITSFNSRYRVLRCYCALDVRCRVNGNVSLCFA